MEAPSGLRRSVIIATFTAMALLVATLWLLEDQIVNREARAGQRAALELALDAYAAATSAPTADRVAEAERVGVAHGCRIRELVPSAAPPDGYRTQRTQRGETLATLTRTLQDGRHVEVRDVQRLRHLVHASVRALVIVGGLVASVVGLLLTWGLTRALVQPARDLTKVADALATGNLSARTRSKRRDELGAIGRSLDRLADQLEERQATLRAQEDRLTTMLDSMAEAVFVTDERGMIDLTNDALDQLVELEPLGRTIIELIRDADLHETVMEAIADDRRDPREVAFDYLVGDVQRHFVAQIAPLEHGGGVIGVVHDVTKHVAADRLRRDFIANASHELRTPVTAIRGYAETLAGGAAKDPKVAARFLEVILRHAGRLEALVDDMVTLSRAESERSEIPRGPVSLSAAALEVVEGLSGLADSKAISVVVEGLEGLPDALANARGVDQVLINLVDNAIKYTPDGGRVWVRGGSSETDVHVDVVNTGPGIPSKHVARVFERFYRVDAGRSREIGGTGLGLAIVKHLTASMGGRIEVASRSEETRFTLTFPRADASPRPVQGGSEAPPSDDPAQA